MTVGKTEMNKELGTLRGKWNDNIMSSITEILCVDVNWSHVSQYIPYAHPFDHSVENSC